MAINAAVEGSYADSVRWAEQALAQNRRFAAALRVMAASLVELGERDRAREVVRQLLAIEPHLTISGFFARIPVPLQRAAVTYASAFAAAGLLD